MHKIYGRMLMNVVTQYADDVSHSILIFNFILHFNK